MTNWRERGYVPASDGEDSDVDFSTQEEEPLALTPPPDAVPTNSIKDPRHNEATRQESTTGETKIEEQHERRTDAIAEQSNHVTDIVHVAPIPAPQQYPESVESKDATDDEFIDIDEALGIATQANRVDNRLSQGIIPVFDLCMTREDADEEVGGVRLQGEGAVGQDKPVDVQIDAVDQTPAAPDPIAGLRIRSSTPAPGANIKVDSHALRPSSVGSSPLSSPPTSPPRTLTPPSSIHPPISELLPTLGLGSPMPSIEATSPDRHRSLRQRNPMQLNPYTVEQQLYRRAMKEKGVRPVRIDYRQASPPKTAAAQDSQDQEYQAPPSPERPRRPRERRPSEPEENGYDMVEAVRLAGLRRALKEASKRQKLTQDYSKKSKIASSPRVPRDAQPPIHQQEAGDIYDFTGSDSTATPLGPPNIRRPPSPTKAPGISNPGHDVMESYFNEPLNLDTEMHGVSATTQPPRPRSISIDSTASSHRTAVPHDGPDSGGSSAEDPSQETLISGDGRSKVVRQYKKRGTRGVLPASYKRIVGEASGNKNRDDNHRRIRGSSTPPPEDRRPGVARAKISSRAREPAVQDLFPQDDSDSGDEPQILGAAPPKPKGKQPARPKIYDLTGDDDIPEDNRIDYGLPPPERRRSNVHKAKRKAKLPGAPTKAPKRVRQGSPSRRGPRKPARPRLGIVEAVAYHKSVENKPLPTFVKVGARSALERRGRGKGSPSGKLFVLHEAEDTQDVLEELRKWRNGELPFGRDETVSHPDQPRYSQPRLPSPQRYGNSESSHRLAARAPSHRKAPPRVKRGQTKLLNFDFQRQKASEKRGRPNQPPPRPLAVVPVRDGFMTHRPVHRPQPAQFEREVPVSQRPRPTGIDDVYQNAWQRKRDLKKTQPSYSLQPVPPQARPTIRTSAPVVETSRSAQAPRIRKRAAKRVDIDIVERRQPPQQDLVVDDGEILDIVMVDDNSAKLQLTGLHPFGSKYSLNFDTLPLKNGTKFNAETFIGKGCLAVALKTPPSRFTTSSQGATYSIGGRSLSWGAYVDSVGTDFEAIMGLISDTAEKRPEGSDSEQSVGLDFVDQVYGFYGFVIKYISETLSFHDPRDVVSFSQRFLQSIENCCGRLSLGFSGPSDIEMIRKMNTRLVLQSNAFCMVMASQIFKLCSESPNVKDLGLPKTVRKIGRELLSRLLRCGVDKVRTCYDDQRRWDQFRRGIAWGSMGAPEADSDPVTADRMKRESQYYLVELWVVAIQTLNSTEAGEVSFWGILNEELHIDRVDKSCDVKVFERLWRNIFTLLPLHQFDESGVARPVNDERPLAENWAAVKVIAERPLQVYNSSKGGHFGTINDYIRMVYARCYHLITKWSWTNSDSLIPTLVKFFSDNGLANLNNEDDTGSPDFLLNLDKNPSTNLLPSDRCFHILLKVIVVGLRNMKATTAIERKKILRFVYRLLPIHGRQYLKEDPLRIDDLTALRNHHYLMETLYWAPPPECRPPLEYLRKTVDPETSHLKACDVSVRAWSNLVRFQLHSGESLEPLKEFMNWFDNLATATLDQYLNVRSEAEKQFKIAKQQQDSNLSDEDLEENIRINQKHLEALLNDLVKSLCNALASIPGQIPSAIVLLTQTATSEIFKYHSRLSNNLHLEVLNLLQQYLVTCKTTVNEPQATIAPAVIVDEDSQDYFDDADGDLSGYEEAIKLAEMKQAAENFLSVAYDSLLSMLSNCFGADRQPEEKLLIKLVDTWTSTAGFLVQNELKTWDVYLEYSRESWQSLRDTEQKRKFAAYFLPKIILSGAENNVYQSNRLAFMGFWLCSLVERESMLKFQNQFTATMLDFDPANPLLANPPFEKDPATGKFKISQFEFKTRRLQLISSVLEKMGARFKEAPRDVRKTLQQEYSEMLRGMMKAMKENYDVSKSSTAAAGTYVDFVHRVVEFLLQHTTDIVELDRFFTDSSEFPLPAMDPNYVVGKLKKYSTGISFSGTQKQLNAFFQALGERAALGNEQQQLVTQLSTALSEEFESGNPAKPTMRAYFMHAVFPAYVEAALNKEHPEAWVLAFPVLSAQARVLRDLKLSMDSAMFLCVNSTIAMLATTLDSFRRTASMALGEDTRALTTVESYLRAARMTDRALSSPHVVATLTLLLRALVHAIPLLAWIYEDAPRAPRETARDSVDFLVRFAVYARRVVGGAQEGEEVQRPLDVLAACRRPESVFGGGRRLAKGSLLGYLKRWERGVVDGTWFVSGRAVVVPEVGEGWREEFGSAVEAVLEAVGREGVFGGGAADDGGGSLRMRERKRVGVQVVLGRLFC